MESLQSVSHEIDDGDAFQELKASSKSSIDGIMYNSAPDDALEESKHDIDSEESLVDDIQLVTTSAYGTV